MSIIIPTGVHVHTHPVSPLHIRATSMQQSVFYWQAENIVGWKRNYIKTTTATMKLHQEKLRQR